MSEKRFDPYTGEPLPVQEEQQEVMEEQATQDGNEGAAQENTEQNTSQPQEQTEAQGGQPLVISAEDKEDVKPEESSVAQVNDGNALACMILGIVSIVLVVTCACSPLAIFTGIAGIICFFVSRKKTGAKDGKALAGMICSCAAIALTVILIICTIIFAVAVSYENNQKSTTYDYTTHSSNDDF